MSTNDRTTATPPEDVVIAWGFRQAGESPAPAALPASLIPHKSARTRPPLPRLPAPEAIQEAMAIHEAAVLWMLGDRDDWDTEEMLDAFYDEAMNNPIIAAAYAYRYGVVRTQEEYRAEAEAAAAAAAKGVR